MEQEIWKDIVSYNGFYQISNFGRIKTTMDNSLTVGARGMFRLKRKERIRVLHLERCGYVRVSLSKNAKCKFVLVHRLVAQAFLPNPKNKPYINHLDGVKTHNHASNLEWCTDAENRAHAKNTGLMARGEKCHLSKLTEEKVLAIREMYSNTKNVFWLVVIVVGNMVDHFDALAISHIKQEIRIAITSLIKQVRF